MKPAFREEEIRKEYEDLTKLLIERNMTITTMESCTSGQIASLITDTEGSSKIIKGALVTYSNEVKIMFGVPEETINTYSVYSNEVSEAMAKSAKVRFDSDISIGVTGTMGNVDPDNQEFSNPGEVFYTIVIGETTRNYKASIPNQESRLMYKLYVAKLIRDSLISDLS